MVDSPTVRSTRYGEVPALSVVATHDPDRGTATVFLVNRSAIALPTTVSLGDLTDAEVTGSHVLTAPQDADEEVAVAKHTAATPGPLADCVIIDGDLRVVLPRPAGRLWRW